MVIFDCNGVLVDSEPIAAAVAADEFNRAGFPLTREVVSRYFTGRRQSDMFAAVEAVTGQELPPNFAAVVAAATLRRLRTELRATAHAVYALTWLQGPTCVASSSAIDRVQISLETTGLLRFFDGNLFSADEVPNGKPAPDLFLHAAAQMGCSPQDCIVVEDSPAGIAAAAAAGMSPIGYVGASHAGPNLGLHLREAGAAVVIADMRMLKSTVAGIRGW